MIIRRRRTRNFTILENEVVEDERLALDEIGLLAWLRSRPDSWEISRAAIGRRFKIGRDKVARIFKSLIECGWMVREPTLPGESARYVVLDEPGAEVEMSREELAEIGEAASPVAHLSQSDNPATGDPLPENPAALVRTDSKQEPTPKPPSVPAGAPAVQSPRPAPAEPPQAAIQGEQAAGPPPEPPGLDRLIRGFANPALVNRAKTLREFQNLTEAEQAKAEDIAQRYSADMRRLKKAPKRLHLWLRDRDFANYVGSTGSLRFVPAKEPAGAAVRVLAALLGNITVPSHWCGRDEAGGAFGYWLWFELEPRFLGLAAAAPERHRWPDFRVGSQHHGAWQDFLDHVMGPERRRHMPVEKGTFRAPWPWPPRVDGSHSEDLLAHSTGPPLSEMSEEDAADFVGMAGR